MKTTKMSLANIQQKLSRAEMKKIMAGSGPYCEVLCDPYGPCPLYDGSTGYCGFVAGFPCCLPSDWN